MGAVRPITTPVVLSLTDDQIQKVSFVGFTFWGYDAVHVGNNGTLSFHQNGVANDDQWDDLGWEYGYTEPLDPDAPNSPYYGPGPTGGGWTRYYRWVGIFPLSNDYAGYDDDPVDNLIEVSYGFQSVGGKQAMLVTWSNGAPLGQSSGDFLRNTFQVVIYEDDTFELNYDKVEWTTPYDWWSPDGGTNLNLIHSLAGYRMVTESDVRHLEITYTNGSGTLAVGDTIDSTIASWYMTAEVLSITGDSTSGTMVLDLSYGIPPSLYAENNQTPPFILTNNAGWTGEWVSDVWHNDGAHDFVDEFEWSRSVTSEPSPLDYTSAVFSTYQLQDVIDGGINSLVTGGDSGRYSSTVPLNWTPHLSVDVQLEGTLQIVGPAAVSGTLDLVVNLGVFVYYFVAGELDAGADLSAQPAWLGSADVASTLTVDISTTGSDYREYVGVVPNADIGGYWNYVKWYDTDWGVAPSNSYVANLDGRECGRFIWPAQPYPGNLGYLCSLHYLSNMAYLFGLDVTFSIWVYVPSPQPMVKLQVANEYYTGNTYMQGVKPTVLQEVATTNHNTWQQLTLTIPASQQATYPGPRFRIMHEQTGAEYYLADPSMTFSGTAYSLSTVDDGEHYQSTNYSYNGYLGTTPTVPIQKTTDVNGRENFAFGWNNDAVPAPVSPTHKAVMHSGPWVSRQDKNDGMVRIWQLQPYVYEGETSVKVSVWVYVPGGYPRVRLGYTSGITNYDDFYDYDLVRPAYSTVWDEWERLEITVRYEDWAYYAAPSTLPSGWSTQQPELYVGADPLLPHMPVKFYVDDWGLTQVPVEPTREVFVYSIDDERGKVSTTVDFSATAYDNDVRPDLDPVSIDVDLGYGWQPIEGETDVVVDMEAFLAGGWAAMYAQLSAPVDLSASLSMSVTLRGAHNSWGYNEHRPPPQLAAVYPTTATDTSIYRSAPDSYRLTWGAQNGNTTCWLGAYVWAYDAGSALVPLPTFCAGYDVTCSIWVRVTSGGPIKLQVVDWHTVYPRGTAWDEEPPVLSESVTTTTGTWEQLTVTIPAALTLTYPEPSVRIYHTQTGAVYHLDDMTWTVSGQRLGAATIDSMEHDAYGNYTNLPYQFYREGPSHNYSTNTSANLWYGDTSNPRTGLANYRFSVTATSGTYSQWCLMPGYMASYYHVDVSWPLTVGAWVKVPAGSPPMALRVVGQMSDTNNYATRTIDFDVVKPVVTTKVDEWEYLEVTVSHLNRSYYQFTAAATQLWGTGLSLSTTNPRPVLAPMDPLVPSTYYIDDVTIRQDKQSVTTPATVGVMAKGYSVANPNVDCVSQTVDMFAEVTLMPPFEGSVSFEMDLFQWVPRPEPVSGTLSIDFTPAKGFRMLGKWWDIPDNPAWKPDWTGYDVPSFEGVGNTEDYDASDWDSQAWHRQGLGWPNTDEWYMAYPWPAQYVRTGRRSMKVRLPVLPNDYPGYHVMEMWGEQSVVCYTRFEVWVYVPEGNSRLVLRALSDWGNVSNNDEPEEGENAVFNPHGPRVYSTKFGEWEKLTLVVDPLIPGNEVPEWAAPPYYWTNHYSIGFELFPEEINDTQVFYVDDYEVFWDRIDDPRIIYLETR